MAKKPINPAGKVKPVGKLTRELLAFANSNPANAEQLRLIVTCLRLAEHSQENPEFLEHVGVGVTTREKPVLR